MRKKLVKQKVSFCLSPEKRAQTAPAPPFTIPAKGSLQPNTVDTRDRVTVSRLKLRKCLY